MDLKEILLKAHYHLGAAQGHFMNLSEQECMNQLGELYDLLDDFFGSKAREKCESDKPPKE